ncbi:MAG: MurR/RpiR family transcriptional regulator [bacterium]
MDLNGEELDGLDPTTRIRKVYHTLRNSERRVAEYVLANAIEVMYIPMRSLAGRCYTSDATVVRFCRALNYASYYDFKRALASNLSGSKFPSTHSEIVKGDSFGAIKEKLANIIKNDIDNTLAILEEENFNRAVEAIMKAKWVEIYGWARSGYIAHILSLHLLNLGIRNLVLTDQFAQERSSTNLGEGDVAIGISYSGVTEWIIGALDRAKRGGAITICMTNNRGSPITQSSDIVLLTAARKAALGADAGTSRIPQLALIDLLTLGISLKSS